jgi:hypothetical protein
MPRARLRPLALAALFAGLGMPAPAAATGCRLALVLALDVSSSVDATEDALQRGGLASALLAPDVQAAFLSAGPPVALAAYEWSGRYNQAVLLDWQLIRTAGDLLEAARTIGTSTRSHDDFPTAMGHALGYGAGMLERAPDCQFRTLDMSGDGENNEGFGPEQAYAAFPFADVTVNGLVINGAEYEAEVTLIDFYRSQVLHGPGAFLEIAQGFDDYERAMRRKLEREVAPRTIGLGIARPRVPPG